jgi:hypothetical protein
LPITGAPRSISGQSVIHLLIRNRETRFGQKKYFRPQAKNGKSVAYPQQTGALLRQRKLKKNYGANTTNLLPTIRVPNDQLPGKWHFQRKDAEL